MWSHLPRFWPAFTPSSFRPHTTAPPPFPTCLPRFPLLEGPTEDRFGIVAVSPRENIQTSPSPIAHSSTFSRLSQCLDHFGSESQGYRHRHETLRPPTWTLRLFNPPPRCNTGDPSSPSTLHLWAQTGLPTRTIPLRHLPRLLLLATKKSTGLAGLSSIVDHH